MEVYWKLASADASVREAASVELVQNLLKGNSDDKVHKQEENEETHKQEEEENKGLIKAHKRKAETKDDDDDDDDDEDASHEDDGLDSYTPSLQYALKRLVQGVASSRECARQGFAMALASLLEAIPSIKIESVLKLIKKSMEVTSSMKGQEKRDGLLGQLFALGAIVRAGRCMADDAHADSPSLARDMIDQLLTLAKRKVFLREPALTVLLHFWERLPKVLQDNVLSSPLLQETLCMELEHASADTLLLALKLCDRLPSSIVRSCPLLPNARGIDALFEPSQLLSLVPVLKDSSSCHPRLHPIWNLLTELLFNEANGHEPLMSPKKKKKKRQKMDGTKASKKIEERVSLFWTIVVDNSLLTSSHERKFLAMEVLQLALPKMPAQSAHILLSKTLVRCLLDILAAKGNLLYKSAQSCLDFIVDWAKANEQKTVATIICLQQGSHGKFDVLSKTQTVKQLVGLLRSTESCSLLFGSLIDLFNGDRDANEFVNDGHGQCKDQRENAGAFVKVMEIQRFWVVEQIQSCIKQICELEPQLCLQKEAVKFLTVNALFVGPPGAKFYLDELQEEEFRLPKQPVSDNIRKLCLARLQSLLLNVNPLSTSLKDKKDVVGEEALTRKTAGTSDLRFFFLQLCDMLDKDTTLSRVQPVLDDDKKTINALKSSSSKLWSLAPNGSSEQRSKMQAMSSLLMQLLLQSVTSGVNEIASELVLCCERAFGELMEVDVNGGTEEDDAELPAFMDVLVDVLLSLLAQSSASVRTAAEQVFRAFSNDLTESTLLSLLRVVKKQLKRGRRLEATPLGVDDTDDDDQFLEIEESDEEVDGVDINDEKNDGDGDDDDNNDKDGSHEKIDKQAHGSERRKKVAEDKEAMADSDHESNKDESESDMDDEAMFRIDVHLANLLKQRGVAGDKKEAKDAQAQLLHFKFRVLSLVEYFFQKKASSILCLTALPHLLLALVLSAGAGGNAQLADRISSVLFRLFKTKEYPKGPEVDMAVVMDLLRRCVWLASRSKSEKVRKVGQSSSLWLAKVLHGQYGGDSDELFKVVQDAMNDFFAQKKSKLKAHFFLELFTRFPGLGVACIPLLVDKVKKARSEYLQYEALSLVTSILHLNTSKNSKEFRECLSQHLPILSKVLVGLVEKPPSKAARKPESRRFYASLLKAISKELPSKPMKKAIGKHAYELCLSHFGASVMGGVKPQEGRAGDMVENTKGKSKKRKSSKDVE